jgi:hypothetical protein
MNQPSDLEVCRTLLDIIDEMSEERQETKIEEAMSDVYGTTIEDQGVQGSVEFKQNKNTDRGSVSIEATGDTMQDLADILKLAGLTLPKEINPDGGEEVEIEVGSEAEPEEDVIISKDDEPCSDCNQDPCVCGEPENTDKEQTRQTLVNIIKDKLQQRLK